MSQAWGAKHGTGRNRFDDRYEGIIEVVGRTATYCIEGNKNKRKLPLLPHTTQSFQNPAIKLRNVSQTIRRRPM